MHSCAVGCARRAWCMVHGAWCGWDVWVGGRCLVWVGCACCVCEWNEREWVGCAQVCVAWCEEGGAGHARQGRFESRRSVPPPTQGSGPRPHRPPSSPVPLTGQVLHGRPWACVGWEGAAGRGVVSQVRHAAQGPLAWTQVMAPGIQKSPSPATTASQALLAAAARKMVKLRAGRCTGCRPT